MCPGSRRVHSVASLVLFGLSLGIFRVISGSLGLFGRILGVIVFIPSCLGSRRIHSG